MSTQIHTNVVIPYSARATISQGLSIQWSSVELVGIARAAFLKSICPADIPKTQNTVINVINGVI
uniref:hypothetical protein n=1 Tax=Delftia acidovorans TaxID=80866 RepID=UPI0028A6BC54|nr:hypothetical protein [Delftia acidovorans]